MTEAQYQAKLIKKIEHLFPGCMVMKTDPKQRQGLPDLLVLHGHRWAALEVKLTPTSDIQPNQEYYVQLMDDLSYGSFICPETEEEVLNELQYALEA